MTRQAVDVRAQAAQVVGELVRQHRRDPAGDVGRERTPGGTAVERRARRDEVRDVGDVHPRAQAVRLLAHRERVVEVLRPSPGSIVKASRSRRSARPSTRPGRIVGLEPFPQPSLDQQPLQDASTSSDAAEHALELCAPAPAAHDREIAGPRVAEPLAVDASAARRA